jgi:hypothetical protein
MSKLRNDLKLALAGACSGLFSASVFLLGARVVSYYEYLRIRNVGGYEGSYDRVEDLWWVPVVVWHVVLSIVASLLMHRYLVRASTFLRWQAIGIVALAGWVFTIFTGIGMQCLIHGNTHSIEHILSVFEFVPVSQFVAAVFASNVLYGTAVQVAASQNMSESIRTNQSKA